MNSMGSDVDVQTEVRPERGGSVRAVERALSLISVLTRSRGPHSVTDLAARLSLPVSTVHRLLHTLMSLGYVTQYAASKRYGAGRGIAELNRAMLLKYEYSQFARPYLERLADTTGETANLAALYGTFAIYLDQVESSAMMRVSNPVGTLVPLHCSAAGKVFLADFKTALLDDTVRHTGLEAHTSNTIVTREALDLELERVRRQGYAFDDEEYAPGARCVAVAMRGSSGTVVAAISVSGPAVRMPDDRIPSLAAQVSAVADEFAERMREP